MADVQDLVDEWLKTTTNRWEQALQRNPPDVFFLRDMPDLPGNVSLGAFIDAVRSRVGSPVSEKGALKEADYLLEPDEMGF